MNIANVITAIAISTSFISIIQLVNHQLYLSVFFGFLSFLIDSLDGFVARMAHKESDVGRQYDSMSDAVIYIIWPSLFYYLAFKIQDLLSVIILCFFVSSGLYRLARFNHLGMLKTRFGKAYPGIPVVFSHLIILLYAFTKSHLYPALICLKLIIILHSFAMISKISFPKPNTLFVMSVLIFSIIVWLIYGQNITY
jgi:CDP-diacylglycerol--serine O-phosphatidyltransferase